MGNVLNLRRYKNRQFFLERNMMLRKGSLDEIQRYICKGKLGVNEPDLWGVRPLHIAAESSRVSLVILLLYHGANPNLMTSSRDGIRSVLTCAVQGQSDILVQLLLGHVISPKLLHVRDEYGKTVLHEAISCKSEKIVELLLRHGANPNIASPSGDFPLEYVTKFCSVAMVKLLLDAGAVFPPDKELSSMKIAATMGRWETLRLLDDYGYDIVQENKNRKSALRSALRTLQQYKQQDNLLNVQKTIELLCSKGAHVNSACLGKLVDLFELSSEEDSDILSTTVQKCWENCIMQTLITVKYNRQEHFDSISELFNMAVEAVSKNNSIFARKVAMIILDLGFIVPLSIKEKALGAGLQTDFPSLKATVRLNIRQRLQGNANLATDQLPLPDILRRYCTISVS